MNLNIYEKSLAVIISGLMLTNLSGCGKKSEKDSMKNESSRLVVDDVESVATEVIPVVTTELVTTTSNSVTTLSTTPVVTTVTTSLDEEINNCDIEVLNHFKAMNDNIVDSYNLDSFLETGKKYFIISPHDDFESLFGSTADKRRKLYNGMIKCQLFMYFKNREVRY